MLSACECPNSGQNRKDHGRRKTDPVSTGGQPLSSQARGKSYDRLVESTKKVCMRGQKDLAREPSARRRGRFDRFVGGARFIFVEEHKKLMLRQKQNRIESASPPP